MSLNHESTRAAALDAIGKVKTKAGSVCSDRSDPQLETVLLCDAF